MSKKPINKLVLSSLAAIAMSVPSLADDQSFLTEAIQGDNSEVSLGRLAEQKGASEETKNFGRELVKDHTKAKKQAMAVARKMKVPETDAISDEAKEERTKLDNLSGPAFDKEFADYMVKDHQQDIQKFEDQAKQGSGKVAKLAKDSLPTLRKHLKAAESLQK